MVDKVTKNVRESGVTKVLYADDLVLLGDSWKEVEKRYTRWKKAITEKSLKVNVKKTKVFRTGEKTGAMETSKFSCSKSRRGVGRNSILCFKCNCCVHKKCSGIRKCLTNVVDFIFRKC